jgi:hypothetical protein
VGEEKSKHRRLHIVILDRITAQCDRQNILSFSSLESLDLLCVCVRLRISLHTLR